MKKRFNRTLYGIMLGAALISAGGIASACAATTDAGKVVTTSSTANSNQKVAEALLNSVSHGSLKYQSSFAGPEKNIDGVIAVTSNGQKMMGWIVDQKYLMPGPMFNDKGMNLTMTAAQAHGLVPKPVNGTLLTQKAMAAPGFTLGKSGPLLVAFLDPNCIFCHKFWRQVAPYVQSGKVRVKVVPVGFLKPSSKGKAITILQSKYPEKAWAANEAGFNDTTEEGATVPAKKLSMKASSEISANTRLLAQSGEVATPTIITCQKGGKNPEVMHGLPENGLAHIVPNAVSVTAQGSCAK